MKLSQRLTVQQQTWLAAILVGGASLAYLPLSFFPQKRELDDLRLMIRQKQEATAQGEKLLGVVRDTKRQLADDQTYLQQNLQTITPDSLPHYFAKLNQAVQEAGATIVRFEPRPATELGMLRKCPVVIGFSGKIEAIASCLQRIESLPERAWVTELKIDSPVENGKPVVCELSLAIFVDKIETSRYADSSDRR